MLSFSFNAARDFKWNMSLTEIDELTLFSINLIWLAMRTDAAFSYSQTLSFLM